MCKCGCNTCETKSTLMLNESLAPRAILSEGLKYHMDANKPLTEHLYRAGSTNYFNLWAEARSLYSRNILEITHEDDLAVLTETDLGHYGMFEGKKVPLDFPMEITEYSSEGEGWDDDEIEIERDGNTISVKISIGHEVRYKGHKGKVVKTEYDGVRVNFPTIGENGLTMHFFYEDLYSKEGYYKAVDESISEDIKERIGRILEAKKKAKKNNKKLNKPMRDSSGGKAYKVYVKDPKTKKIKTIRFGSGGLRAKINDKKARNAFAKRHKCSTKKDKTKAGYWSCRLPRYAKLLGLKSNFSGFW